MSKMVLRLIGVGQHPEVYKVMDVDGDANAGHIPEKGCGCCWSGDGKLEVVIHWQIDSIDAGTNTLLQYTFE